MREEHKLKRQRGFTLIEVIVVLTLVGLLAAMSGFGLVTVARGYLMASENAAVTQKAQLAMTRLGREIMECFDCDGITYPLPFSFRNNLPGPRELALDAGVLRINTRALVDQVEDFSLHPDDDGRIVITLVIRHQHGGGDQSFSTSIFPRNTYN